MSPGSCQRPRCLPEGLLPARHLAGISQLTSLGRKCPRVKIEPQKKPIFPFTRVPFGVPNFDPQPYAYMSKQGTSNKWKSPHDGQHTG